MNTASDIKNVESEAGIIASIINNPELTFYSERLRPNHFSDPQNAYLYYAICELARRGIQKVDAYNITNVLNMRESTRKQTETLTVDVINELIDLSGLIARDTPEEYKMLVSNVLDAAFRRDTYQKLVECERACMDMKETDIEEKIYSTLDDVMMEYSTNAEMPQYKDIVDGIWDEIKERQNGVTKAIEFPFPALNQYVVMEPGEAICFAAPQKTGKSAMLLTCAVDLLRKGKSVLYIDSEISTRLFTTRLLAHITGIKFSKIRSGNYSKEEEDILNSAVSWIKEQRFIHIYVPQLDENTMYLAAKKAKHLIDIDCIIVDYLKADSSSSDAYEVYSSLGKVSDCLKNKIAGEMGICCLTAAQATASGKIADSAKIARSMSTIVMISDKSLEEIAENGGSSTKKMRVLFNRNGSQHADNEWIDMDFDGSVCKYSQSEVQHVVEEPF